jgi:hypothetical protein
MIEDTGEQVQGQKPNSVRWREEDSHVDLMQEREILPFAGDE